MPPDYEPSDYVYVVNYYGQVFDVRFEHIIMDNVQAYFQTPIDGVDTIYTCRKYFGVTDGAYLYTDSRIDRELERDISWGRIEYLAGRLEKSGSEFYSSYQSNEELLNSLPLKRMSAFTENILKSIDYECVIKQRENNFRYLHERLGKINLFQISIPTGPFAYPFMVADGGKLRRYLQSKKIYVAKLWPNVQQGKEGELAEIVVPIPCDQRYSEKEMKMIITQILKLVKLKY